MSTVSARMKYLIPLAVLAVLFCLTFGIFKWQQRKRDAKWEAGVKLGRSVSEGLASYA